MKALPDPLPTIDWGEPWFSGLRGLGQSLIPGRSVAERLQALMDDRLSKGLGRIAVFDGGRAPVFVPQAELPPCEAYEAYIDHTGRIPTRNNLHDLLNGLVWLRHPALKGRMNELQATIIERDGVGAQRGPARDALTLFDENGAVWQDADPLLVDALGRRDWQALFVEHRSRWAGQSFEICGHALLEQLVRAPRKGLVAHVCIGQAPWTMDEAAWSTKPFMPLPVLGIPGWWPGQEDPVFYGDTRVFRLPRS